MDLKDALLHKDKIKEISKNPEKHLAPFRKSILFSVAMYVIFLIIQFLAMLLILHYYKSFKLVLVLIGYNVLSTITKLHWDNARKTRKLYDIAEKLVEAKQNPDLREDITSNEKQDSN